MADMIDKDKRANVDKQHIHDQNKPHIIPQVLPNKACVQKWYELCNQQSGGTLSKRLREQALTCFQHANDLCADKEFARFMKPALKWTDEWFAQSMKTVREKSHERAKSITLHKQPLTIDSIQRQSNNGIESNKTPHELIPLGNGAWLADIDHMPSMPTLLKDVLTEKDTRTFFKGPIASFVGSVFTAAHVLYIPKNSQLSWGSLLKMLDRLSVHLLFIIVERDSSVVLKNSSADFNGDQINEDKNFLNHRTYQLNHNNQEHSIKARTVIGFIGENAQVTLESDRVTNEGDILLSEEVWFVEKNAQLTSRQTHVGGESYQVKTFHLSESAVLSDDIHHVLKENDKATLITEQIHEGKSSTSAVNVKSLLLDNAHAFYRGTIKIDEQAGGSQADQQHKSLILGNNARSCAIPSLEVKIHDVQCKHGSAAGRFNKNELEYLLAHGLDKQQVYMLLIQGFFQNYTYKSLESANLIENIIQNCFELSI